MSIQVRHGNTDPWEPPEDEPCFLCGERIGKTAIMWMGQRHENDNPLIYWHPHCALSFARRILEDAERYYSPDPKTLNTPTPEPN